MILARCSARVVERADMSNARMLAVSFTVTAFVLMAVWLLRELISVPQSAPSNLVRILMNCGL